jgi:hypothetical protein
VDAKPKVSEYQRIKNKMAGKDQEQAPKKKVMSEKMREFQ